MTMEILVGDYFQAQVLATCLAVEAPDNATTRGGCIVRTSVSGAAYWRAVERARASGVIIGGGWSRDLGLIPNVPGIRIAVLFKSGGRAITTVMRRDDGTHHLLKIDIANLLAWKPA